MSASEIFRYHAAVELQLPAATDDFVLSGTYLFQTREGSVGIMQMSLYTAYPRSLRIRYKLVQPDH